MSSRATFFMIICMILVFGNGRTSLIGAVAHPSPPYPMSTFTFTPNPAVFYRCAQCPPAGTSGNQQPTPMSIAQLLLPSVPYSASQPPSATLANVSAVPNLLVELLPVLYPIVPFAGSAAAPATNEALPCPAGGPQAGSRCAYVLNFALTKIPSAGFANDKVVVNVQQGGQLIGTAVVSLNFNCAPVFQAISANIGPTPGLVSFTTLTLGDGIRHVKAPQRHNVSPVVTANTASSLASYLVNFNTPTGIGAVDRATDNNSGVGPGKVWVSCNTGIPSARKSMGGITVIAIVKATDPQNAPISYFAYSGVPETAASPGSVGREIHTVTREGVVSISSVAGTAGIVDPGTPGIDANGGAIGALLAPTGTPQAPKDMFIVAQNSVGCTSTLQARFYLACGEVVA